MASRVRYKTSQEREREREECVRVQRDKTRTREREERQRVERPAVCARYMERENACVRGGAKQILHAAREAVLQTDNRVRENVRTRQRTETRCVQRAERGGEERAMKCSLRVSLDILNPQRYIEACVRGAREWHPAR